MNHGAASRSGEALRSQGFLAECGNSSSLSFFLKSGSGNDVRLVCRLYLKLAWIFYCFPHAE